MRGSCRSCSRGCHTYRRRLQTRARRQKLGDQEVQLCNGERFIEAWHGTRSHGVSRARARYVTWHNPGLVPRRVRLHPDRLFVHSQATANIGLAAHSAALTTTDLVFSHEPNRAGSKPQYARTRFSTQSSPSMAA